MLLDERESVARRIPVTHAASWGHGPNLNSVFARRAPPVSHQMIVHAEVCGGYHSEIGPGLGFGAGIYQKIPALRHWQKIPQSHARGALLNGEICPAHRCAAGPGASASAFPGGGRHLQQRCEVVIIVVYLCAGSVCGSAALHGVAKREVAMIKAGAMNMSAWVQAAARQAEARRSSPRLRQGEDLNRRNRLRFPG